ncbi:MAG: M13 family metallopeptidase, partial [Mucilaginibacter sp.]
MIKINFLKVSIIALAGITLLNACKPKQNDHPVNDPVYTDRDTTVKPGDDFFQYANGAWLKKNPIPAAYSSWGIGRVVQEELRDRLKKINEDALKENAAKGTTSQKIGDFYYSGMDTVAIEKQGLSPLKDELTKIDG